MATFKEIRGQLIKKYTTNPTDPLEGQMWYNNTTGTLKGLVVSAAWSSGSPMNTARSVLAPAQNGTQSSALGFGGTPGTKADTEEYNGSGWSTGGNLNTARENLGGAGTQTAGLAMGGNDGSTVASTHTEEYNGTGWTTNPSGLGTGRSEVRGTGIQTAALAAGGIISTGPYPVTNATEEYSGSAWTAGGVLNTARGQGACCGTQTDALYFGGLDPSVTAATEEYNGTGWTAQNAMNTARGGIAASGTAAGAVGFGGTSSSTATETYDGTTWTTSPATLSTGRSGLGGTGTNSAGLAFGGSTGSATSATEEFNRSASVVTAGAWASGNNMNTAEQNPGGFGIQTAAVSVGGNTPPNSNKTENYDGTSWAVSGVYPQSLIGIGTAGTQTAGLAFGGRVPAGVTTCNEYDGSSWTAATAYPTIISLACGVGPQTAALAATGDITPAVPRYTDLCNDYNGTSWTAATSNTGSARYDAMAAGTATAAAICGGTESASGATEEYDGTNWTVGGANLFNVSAGGSSKNGTSDDWMIFGGSFPSNNLVRGYDGTAWSTRPSLATARFGVGGAGTGTSALCFAGREPGYSTATEEFTGDTSAANIVTVTTS